MTSAFSWQNLISFCPASFYTPRPNLPITPGVSWLPTFAFESPIMKGHLFGVLVLEGLAAAAKLLQSCLTLCDPIDSSPPSYPVPGILQARIMEWVAISFSSAWKWKVKVKSLSCVWLFATPWTAAYQAPPSMGFSRQEYWSGVPLPSPFLGPNKWQIAKLRKVCLRPWLRVSYNSNDSKITLEI